MQGVAYPGHCLKRSTSKKKKDKAKCAGTLRYLKIPTKFLPKKNLNSTKEGKGYALPIYALSLQGLPFDNEENLLTFE